MNRPNPADLDSYPLASRILYLISVLDYDENVLGELLVSVVDRDELADEVGWFMDIDIDDNENSGLFTETEVCHTLNKVRMILHEST